MATYPYDTHKYITTLIQSGVPVEQAEAHSKAFTQAQLESSDAFATKGDIYELTRTVKDLNGETSKQIAVLATAQKWMVMVGAIYGAISIPVMGWLLMKVNDMSATLAVVAELVKK